MPPPSRQPFAAAPVAAAEDPSLFDVVLEVLEGCGPFALAEASALGEAELVGPTEVRLRTHDLTSCRTLRRAVAASVVLRVPGHRPTEILETSAQQRLDDLIRLVRRLKPREPFTGIRLRAAGADSLQMRRILEEVAEAQSLPVDEDGDLVLRVRRAPHQRGLPEGWEILVRLTARPLATRPWRTDRYPGAVNGTIAASVLDLLDVGPEDSLLDMTCGSGTFLIEQLHERAPARAVGVDLSQEALATAERHQRAARRRGRIQWIHGDVREVQLEGGFTRVVTNPPWGTLHGDHATNQALLADLLERAGQLAVPGARLGVLTHEIRRMEDVIEAHVGPWTLEHTHRFFQKGHHPRLYLFTRSG